MTRPLGFTLAVRVAGQRRTVKVLVYETLAQMRAAGRRATGEPFTNAHGICHGWIGEQNPRATIRLARESLTSVIALHELVHAAQWVYACEAIKDGDLAIDHFQPDNETFAHLMSDLWADFEAQMLRHGFVRGATS